MFFSKALQTSILVPAALAIAIPAELDLKTGKITTRVDQPDNPWINDNCFNPLTEYTECPKKKELQEDHWCPVDVNENDCESYCERSLKWNYGREVPFDNSYCGKGTLCRLDETMTVSVAQTTTFGLQIGHGAFTLGASFSWTDSKTSSAGMMREKPEDRLDDCGYWTFVPFMVTSCGVTSKASVHENVLNSRWCADRVDKEECLTSVYQTKAGVAGGAVIFVATDCDDDNRKLPFCKQDPIYLKLGVSSDDQVHLDYREAWVDYDESKGILTTAEVQCELGNWPME